MLQLWKNRTQFASTARNALKTKKKRPKNYRVSNMSDDKKRNYNEKCRYCHKPGHKENVCFKKQRDMAHHAEEESEDHHGSKQTKNSAG